MKSRYEAMVKPRLQRIGDMVRRGCKEDAIAQALHISRRTLQQYKQGHEELRRALSGTVDESLAVEEAFYQRAVGGTYREISEEWVYDKDEQGHYQPRLKARKVYTREVPPDIGAAKFWLLNRAKERWSEEELSETDKALVACSDEALLEQRRVLLEQLKDWDGDEQTNGHACLGAAET